MVIIFLYYNKICIQYFVSWIEEIRTIYTNYVIKIFYTIFRLLCNFICFVKESFSVVFKEYCNQLNLPLYVNILFSLCREKITLLIYPVKSTFIKFLKCVGVGL